MATSFLFILREDKWIGNTVELTDWEHPPNTVKALYKHFTLSYVLTAKEELFLFVVFNNTIQYFYFLKNWNDFLSLDFIQ